MKKSVLIGALMISQCMFATEMAFSVGGMKWDYLETDTNGAPLDSEDSGFSDVTGGAMELRFGDDSNNDAPTSISTLGFEYYTGKTRYVGAYIGIPSVYGDVVDETDIDLLELSYRNGMLWNVDYNWKVGVEVGAGYRQWKRDIGYMEDYSWPYVLGGIGAQFNLVRNQSIKVMADYRLAISPTMEADGVATFDLTKVRGYLIGITYKAPIAQSMFFEASYKRDHWDIGKSPAVSGFYEPDSTTDNDYLTIGISYRF